MPPTDPARAKVFLENTVTRLADNLYVSQKLYNDMLSEAQRGRSLQSIWAGESEFGRVMADQRAYIHALKTYLAEARSALAQSGPAIRNFLSTTYRAGVQYRQLAGQFIAQYQAEVQAGGSGAIAATGAALKYYLGGSAAAGTTTGTAAAATTAAGVAAGDTVAGGLVAAGTVAAGVAAAETVAGGVAAAETVATAAAAEGTVGATLATGATGGSWLGPVGIAIGIAIAVLVVGGVYVYTRRGSDRPATVTPATTATAPSSPPPADLFTCPQAIDGWTFDASLSGLHDLENGKYSFSCSYQYLLGFLAEWYEAPASASCPIDGFVTGPSGMGGNIVSTTKLAMVTYTADSAGYAVSAPSMKDHAQELLAVVEARAAPCPR